MRLFVVISLFLMPVAHAHKMETPAPINVFKTLKLAETYSLDELEHLLSKATDACSQNANLKIYLRITHPKARQTWLNTIPSDLKNCVYRIKLEQKENFVNEAETLEDWSDTLQSFPALQQIIISGPVDVTYKAELQEALPNLHITTEPPKIGVIHIHGDIDSAKLKFLSSALALAEATPQIHAILLEMDSNGGGAIAGLNMFYMVTKAKKPIYSYVHEKAFSAGYAIIAGSKKIYASSHSRIGSIGAVSITQEPTKWLKFLSGLKIYTFIRGCIHPSFHITRKTLLHIQQKGEKSFRTFQKAVAKGRNLTAEEISSVATGEVWEAKDALKLGLIDKISSRDAVLTQISHAIGSHNPTDVLIIAQLTQATTPPQTTPKE